MRFAERAGDRYAGGRMSGWVTEPPRAERVRCRIVTGHARIRTALTSRSSLAPRYGNSDATLDGWAPPRRIERPTNGVGMPAKRVP